MLNLVHVSAYQVCSRGSLIEHRLVLSDSTNHHDSPTTSAMDNFGLSKG